MTLAQSDQRHLLARRLTSEMSEDQRLIDGTLQILNDLSDLSWAQLKLNIMHIQQDNLKTLVDLWPTLKDCQENDTKWGDEIEYVLLRLDHENRNVKIAPEGSHVIGELSKDKSDNAVDIQREAYEYMVETSPSKPYVSSLRTMTTVEQNMRDRRRAIQRQLDNTTAVFSLSRFGMFGSTDPNSPDGAATPEAIREEANSLITKGARYKPILDAIEKKRGFRMNKEASLYENNQSMSSSSVSVASCDSAKSSVSVSIDNPIYSIGGCAVQVNFGLKDLSQALYLHDQFSPIGPLMLALTAASPIVKGFLIETDARWDHCVQASDDRSPAESQLKSRWGTSPMYFEDQPEVQALNVPLYSTHESLDEFERQLKGAGMSAPMATYYAHALARDPMMHPKAIPGTTSEGDLDDRIVRLKTHLSAIWPHIRLKLASPKENMPWMIEFRSMETQPTDFEIAAVVVFLKLLEETLLHYRLELRIPMNLVEDNMDRAQVADAVEEQRFWFNTTNTLSKVNEKPEVYETSLDEIFNGQKQSMGERKSYPGLLHYVREFLTLKAHEENLSGAEVKQIESYLDLISRRASGAEPTPAKWMREFVLAHPDYSGDSVVTQEMYYEMMCRIGERSKIWA